MKISEFLKGGCMGFHVRLGSVIKAANAFDFEFTGTSYMAQFKSFVGCRMVYSAAKEISADPHN